MEVKSIFANLIMKSYEKHGSAKAVPPQSDTAEKEPGSDKVSISPNASKRLFGDLMEHSLKKGLSEVRRDENK